MDKPDKADKAMMTNLQITPAVPATAAIIGSAGSMDRRIRAFLDGDSHGEDVLGALYGHVVDEPIPERLRALLRS
ncbi:MAG TPA: NepR family anti-sigma factor [Stellaceae bacterium]|nr:NepR family anti-sigma factor [Stellaceae bacterium]